MAQPLRYRRYVRDTVQALYDMLHGMGEESQEDTDRVLDEVNTVYAESKMFRDIVGIMNNDFETRQQRFEEVKRITDEYQNNLFNQL